MTAVGKILVFFNLIFSLVVGAFVVYTYINQTDWKAAYDDMKQRFIVADASNAAYQKQIADADKAIDSTNKEVLTKVASDADLKAKIDKVLNDTAGIGAADPAADKVAKVTRTLTAALDDAAQQKKLLDGLRTELATARKTLADDSATVTEAQAQVAKHQAESQQVRDRLTAEVNKNLDLVVQVGKAHDEQVAMKIKADLYEQRARELEKENDKLAHDNQKLLATGGGSAGGSLTSTLKKDGPNPPLDSVEGLISEVDSSGLVRITIGSDAGLAKGNTLEVYRLNTQAPDQSKYVGRIRLIDVRNNQAVGQLMGKPAAPPQPGDTVSSRISGG